MKVILVNGSPHSKGCTDRALREVAATLEAEGIETSGFWLGTQPLAGCIDCHKCEELGRCIFDDKVNEFMKLAADYDGFIFGTPVHYAAAAGCITSFLDRVFILNGRTGADLFRLKPAAGVVSARRAGTTVTYDQLNKFFGIAEMPIVSSRYWNMVHGNTAEEVEQDAEGLQIMRVLGRNMAFLLKCKQVGIENGVSLPEPETPVMTNYIR